MTEKFSGPLVRLSCCDETIAGPRIYSTAPCSGRNANARHLRDFRSPAIFEFFNTIRQKQPATLGQARTILMATLATPSRLKSPEMRAARRWVTWLCTYSGVDRRYDISNYAIPQLFISMRHQLYSADA
jgi:hypothetical protein